MREIKFRAWDKKVNDMVYISNEICFINGQWKPVTNNWDWYKRDYELMQFTGLTDKNGKEIYEGDLCSKDDKIYEVHWSDEHAGFRLKVIKSSSILCRNMSFPMFQYAIENTLSLNVEVIGNIYESEVTPCKQ